MGPVNKSLPPNAVKQLVAATKQFRGFHEKLPKPMPPIVYATRTSGDALGAHIFQGDTSMTSTGSVFRDSKFVAATVLAFGLMTTASFAYTAEQQQLCTGDAMRLCSSEIPDVDRVTACMIAKQSQLSDGCKSVFRPMGTTPQPVNYPATGKPHQPLKIAPIKKG
jgi:hypothetical protein